MTGVIAKNIGMTQLYLETGEAVPVSLLQLADCRVTQVKSASGPDGYNAIQVGAESRKEFKKTPKPLRGHLKKSDLKAADLIREFRVEDASAFQVGQKLNADLFEEGERVRITGISKGKGFAGVMRRHGFSGGPKTHGSHSQRRPGSIGMSADPSRVHKGMKMAGRLGGARVTLPRVEVVRVYKERNVIVVKGAVPGGLGGRFLLVSKLPGQPKKAEVQ